LLALHWLLFELWGLNTWLDLTWMQKVWVRGNIFYCWFGILWGTGNSGRSERSSMFKS
jgi:hypothetical protein